jgi:hypothetical protein
MYVGLRNKNLNIEKYIICKCNVMKCNETCVCVCVCVCGIPGP